LGRETKSKGAFRAWELEGYMTRLHLQKQKCPFGRESSAQRRINGKYMIRRRSKKDSQARLPAQREEEVHLLEKDCLSQDWEKVSIALKKKR